jgi:pyrimidine operon attenuation protein / uracil phosphoribosyltransferase
MAQEPAPVQVLREVMAADDIRRALTRIAHEIVERNHGLDGVVIVGLQRGGVWIAQLLSEILRGIDPVATVPVGSLDASFFRDDVGLRPIVPGSVTEIPGSLDGTTVVLVDDVLYTGRTVRAALEAMNEYGRPRAVQLAVIVDRGHRELPIRPDFVGKNLPTSVDEDVQVSADGVRIAKIVTTPGVSAS